MKSNNKDYIQLWLNSDVVNIAKKTGNASQLPHFYFIIL